MQVQLLTSTAIAPTRATEHSISFDLHLDMDSVTVKPNFISFLSIGFAAKAPSGAYLRIALCRGLTVKHNMHTLAGVVNQNT